MDLEPYLRDISPGYPCGLDLQCDPDYVELARVMQGTAEVEYGGMRIDAADPDWKAAKALALNLLSRSRDLRLAVWLARILMGLHGFAGLEDGLALIETSIERHWDAVHPLLDPDDDNDPTERLNILASLSDDALLRQVRLHALARSADGCVCLRDIEIASGELKPRAGEDSRTMAVLAAVFHDADATGLATLADIIEAACGRLDRIDAMVGEHVRYAGAGVEKLNRLLRHAAGAIREQLDSHPGYAALAGMDEAPSPDMDGGAAADGSTGLSRETIEDRDDVVRQIDRICDYYAMNEPGSPVPMLLQRARRLVNMNFIELMSELSPQGLAEISVLLGIRDQGGPADADVQQEAYLTFNGDMSG
ncbi:ImpA N-terminal domain-containing protein [Bordetella sputigena]|uniref:type VI secretion system protein TssA n=1 Tax=Bordetella sputigena TaxID=1416810 RepID=UPI0039F0ED76